MKAPGDIGWKKWHKLQRDKARRDFVGRLRAPRYSRYFASLGGSGSEFGPTLRAEHRPPGGGVS